MFISTDDREKQNIYFQQQRCSLIDINSTSTAFQYFFVQFSFTPLRKFELLTLKLATIVKTKSSPFPNISLLRSSIKDHHYYYRSFNSERYSRVIITTVRAVPIRLFLVNFQQPDEVVS